MAGNPRFYWHPLVSDHSTCNKKEINPSAVRVHEAGQMTAVKPGASCPALGLLLWRRLAAARASVRSAPEHQKAQLFVPWSQTQLSGGEQRAAPQLPGDAARALLASNPSCEGAEGGD